ncbi:hypothetical protein [Photobacterium carnosum]|uniref:Glycine zipper family protein n=1 Tax=Photobacterium carnosum TaxID=2023717 RepID=A0A2N4USR4_9GAMM|nr:hypothetical protein [Photobacterium carnosum]PLC58050.1 hypothetical protein CIK00_10305 [Photobacterium carnosum]
MLKKTGISILSAVILFTQVGCAQNGSSNPFSNDSTNLVIQSATEEQIMKEATVAGTVGGVAVSALLISTIGKNWPAPVQLAVSIGGTIAIAKIAQFVAMEQIGMLSDVTLENDQNEALLTEARKVNANAAKFNADLKASVNKYKKNQEGLPDELTKAKDNQKQAKLALENRKHLLNMLVKDSAQHKEFAKEVKILEKENIKLASAIKQLNDIEVGAV